MNEIFDRLLIRMVLVVIVCALVVAYKYAHIAFYPSVKKQVTKRFYPAENPADTVHLFSRLVGFTIILSTLGFNESHGIFLAIFHFIVWATLTCTLYLVSLYFFESMVLYNFDYKDEVLKKKNLSYAIICFAHAIAIAHVTQVVVQQSDNSLIILLVLWLLAMVVMGFGSKYFRFVSQLSFEKLITNQKISVALAYTGFILGVSWLVGECFDQEHYEISVYCIQVLLKVLLALIIFPLFKRGIAFAFKTYTQSSDLPQQEYDLLGWGYGFYECCLFLGSAILTSMIVNHIHFGTIYPFF